MGTIVDLTDSLPRHESRTYAERSRLPTQIIVHHSATSTAVTPTAIALYHVQERDWPGIGYHFCIDAAGTIYQTNDLMTMSWHAGDGSNDPRNANTYSIGVCLIGDFSEQSPNEYQLAGAKELIGRLRAMVGTELPAIGHKQAWNVSTQCPGDTWYQWRHRLEPTLYHKGSFHFQKHGYRSWMTEHVRKSGTGYVKQMDPDQTDYRFPAAKTICRLYWDGEPDLDMVWAGAQGAHSYMDMAWPRIEACGDWGQQSAIWEGPNEFGLTSREAVEALITFEAERIRIMHEAGYQVAVGQLGTGQPDEGWFKLFWEAVAQEWGEADLIAVHEYSMGPMPEPPMDGHIYRIEMALNRVLRPMLGAGMIASIPPIAITEHGIDRTGQPNSDGWRYQCSSREEYVDGVHRYLRRMALLPEVIVVTPFTWTHENWPGFAHEEADSKALVEDAYLALGDALPTGEEPVMTEEEIGTWVSDFVQEHILPLNPDAALYKAAKLRNPNLTPASDEVRPVEVLETPPANLPNVVVQAFRDPENDDWQEIAWTIEGEWASEQVRWVKREN